MRVLSMVSIALTATGLLLVTGCEDGSDSSKTSSGEDRAATDEQGNTPSAEPSEAAADEEPSEEQDPSEEQKIAELSVERTAKLIESGEAVPIDANGDDVRAEHGIVPGAKLLTSSAEFDPSTELPSDKATKLIFYCANPDCGASHEAAARARQAGYADVNVMPAGIEGWVEAGRKTAPATKS